MLRTSFRIAVKALNRHKLRTALTMLGMTIGVAAVITMVALGSGAQETVSDDIQSAGTALINVRAGNYTRGGEESNIGSGESGLVHIHLFSVARFFFTLPVFSAAAVLMTDHSKKFHLWAPHLGYFRGDSA
jgi:ABC-type antimicrobial peptide transport system permease subunit